jgi:hypothetical protein
MRHLDLIKDRTDKNMQTNENKNKIDPLEYHNIEVCISITNRKNPNREYMLS